jgi:hypothetical protein
MRNDLNPITSIHTVVSAQCLTKVLHMQTIQLNIPHYPMLRFIVRYGARLAIVAAVVCGCLVVAACAFLGLVLSVATGCVTGVAVYVVCRTAVELLWLVTDMLLPK